MRPQQRERERGREKEWGALLSRTRSELTVDEKRLDFNLFCFVQHQFTSTQNKQLRLRRFSRGFRSAGNFAQVWLIIIRFILFDAWSTRVSRFIPIYLKSESKIAKSSTAYSNDQPKKSDSLARSHLDLSHLFISSPENGSSISNNKSLLSNSLLSKISFNCISLNVINR